MSPAAHLELASHWGPVQPHPAYDHVEGYPEITVLDNDEARRSLIERWHTDMTFSPTPPLGSLLHGVTIPASGGDTEQVGARASAPSDLPLTRRPQVPLHDRRVRRPPVRGAPPRAPPRGHALVRARLLGEPGAAGGAGAAPLGNRGEPARAAPRGAHSPRHWGPVPLRKPASHSSQRFRSNAPRRSTVSSPPRSTAPSRRRRARSSWPTCAPSWRRGTRSRSDSDGPRGRSASGTTAARSTAPLTTTGHSSGRCIASRLTATARSAVAAATDYIRS